MGRCSAVYTGIPTNTIVRSTTRRTVGNDSPRRTPSSSERRSKNYDVGGVVAVVSVAAVLPLFWFNGFVYFDVLAVILKVVFVVIARRVSGGSPLCARVKFLNMHAFSL